MIVTIDGPSRSGLAEPDLSNNFRVAELVRVPKQHVNSA